MVWWWYLYSGGFLGHLNSTFDCLVGLAVKYMTAYQDILVLSFLIIEMLNKSPEFELVLYPSCLVKKRWLHLCPGGVSGRPVASYSTNCCGFPHGNTLCVIHKSFVSIDKGLRICLKEVGISDMFQKSFLLTPVTWVPYDMLQ